MSKRKKKQQMNIRVIIGTSLFAWVLTLTVLSFNWSTFTGLNNLEDIEIKGAFIIPADEYKESLAPVLGTSMNDINTRNMSLLLESHPFVHAARISKNYPNKIVVEIVERHPVAMLNMDPLLYIDREGIVLPELGNVGEEIIPIMSGFNSARELYPIGHQTVSQKVSESIALIDYIIEHFPYLYENLSEVTLNSNDEFVLILANYPTKVILGNERMEEKIQILNSFEQSLPEEKGLHNFSSLDLRYNRQVIVKVKV
ncbi:MAG: FtsQ-type POTRA domain-containing protein [Candidatus Marinimicrobia bacterium]|nr:FtsQ-type POTRA domain-containing protein [Candidatus Neomarinimicrobiota bacterium]